MFASAADTGATDVPGERSDGLAAAQLRSSGRERQSVRSVRRLRRRTARIGCAEVPEAQGTEDHDQAESAGRAQQNLQRHAETFEARQGEVGLGDRAKHASDSGQSFEMFSSLASRLTQCISDGG